MSSTNKVGDVSIEPENKNEKYPKIVFLIIINEFCERFSFYGFRTILYIFFTSFLKLEKDTATALYHAFICLCYFTPIFGAILADGFIGLYKTILYLSMVYAGGEVILTLTSMGPLGAPNLYGPLIGLILAAIGTGGIKPCVSAFGGNQFKPTQNKYLASFFSLFYLSINIGSTIGTLITPVLRSDIKCFGDDCYPLAFGLPAILMIVSVVVFLIGTPYYIRDKPKGKDNVILQTGGCIYYALRNTISYKKDLRDKKEHWLDYAEGQYSSKMIADVKVLVKVVTVFLPLPLFWALYDQQASRWTSQAQQLSGIIGSWTVKPDQFQAVNPILIVAMVPFFDMLVYPAFKKVGLLQGLLQRMSVGMVLTILSFLVSAFLEHNMNLRTDEYNTIDKIKIINLTPCRFDMMMSEGNNEVFPAKYLQNSEQVFPKSIVDELIQNANGGNFSEMTFKIKGECNFQNASQVKIEQDIVINNLDLPKSVIFYFNKKENNINIMDFGYNLKETEIGYSQIKFVSFNLRNVNATLSNSITKENFDIYDLGIESKPNELSTDQGYIDKIDYAKYSLKAFYDPEQVILDREILLETCTKYTVLLFPNALDDSQIDYILLTDVYASGLSIGWQLFQIFVITCGEIMFSISGLTFAYAEAPQSMKSVISAIWLLTVAVGNLIVVIIAESKFLPNQVYEYLLFAGLLLLGTVCFIVLSFFYKYENNDENEDGDKEIEEKYIEPTKSEKQPIKEDAKISYKTNDDEVAFS